MASGGLPADLGSKPLPFGAGNAPGGEGESESPGRRHRPLRWYAEPMRCPGRLAGGETAVFFIGLVVLYRLASRPSGR